VYVTLQSGNASLRMGGKRAARKSAPFAVKAMSFLQEVASLRGAGTCRVASLREIAPLSFDQVRHISLFRPNASWLHGTGTATNGLYDGFMLGLARQYFSNWLTAREMLLSDRQPYFALRLREDAGWYAPFDIDQLLWWEQARLNSTLRLDNSRPKEPAPHLVTSTGETPLIFRPCMHFHGLSDKLWLGSRRRVAWLAETMWFYLLTMPPAPPHFVSEERHILTILLHHEVPFVAPKPTWAAGKMTAFGIPVSDAIEKPSGDLCFSGYLGPSCPRAAPVRMCRREGQPIRDADLQE
jgi:hypothetical protein